MRLFGTSRTLAVGPVAVVSLMTAAAIAPIASAGQRRPTLAAALILALLSGVILVLMGGAAPGLHRQLPQPSR